ncbi:homing endonuclease associated repeat-containing protein [Enterococcus sp. AZ194]|uniref:homing endonuclease associated repeat-containing protein n=1 Tax=Enterococcus sp. AZ194 TaxID=2774629 RepID=UPI003F686EC2
MEAVQLFEKTHGEPPTAKQFRWSSTAIRQFGIWDQLIETAGFALRESKGIVKKKNEDF